MVTASRWGFASQSLWSGRDSIGAIAISDGIASLLLHTNELNKIVSERTRKNEEVGPIPSLLAQFFRNGDCFKMGVCITIALGEILLKPSRFGDF
jgi:hypothetical protein